MLRQKSRFIDDEAEEDNPLSEEEDSDIDDLSITTEAAAAEDEDFIVEIVKRRFGIAERIELDSGSGVAADIALSSGSLRPVSSLVGLRGSCSVGYNSDCSKPVSKSGSSGVCVPASDQKSTVDRGLHESGPSGSVRGGRSRKLPKTSLQPVVSTSLSQRVKSSQHKAAVSSNTTQVSADAISTGVQAATPMDTTSTAL